jgi:hypothetical protein
MPPPSEHCSKRCGVGEKCRTGRHNNKWPELIRSGAERRLEPIYSATRVDAITTHYSPAELSNLI